MKTNNNVKKLVLLGVLSGLVIALQLLSNYIQIGNISITLSLTPIVLGSILLGPMAGFFLGLINGIVILFAPSTTILLSYNFIGTIIIALLKTSVGGLISGFIYKALNKNHFVLSVVLSSISLPIINTLLFTLSLPIIYKDFIIDVTPEGTKYFIFIITSLIGINFIIEFLTNSILSPTLIFLTKYHNHKYKNKR